jgi:hypothetical protein
MHVCGVLQKQITPAGRAAARLLRQWLLYNGYMWQLYNNKVLRVACL